jgi:peptide deformylase
MFEDLKIICWPDPRLLKKSNLVEEFDQSLSDLAQRMLELMREGRGVGLAAPQVGRNIRLFVMNATGKPEDERIYVNPVLSDPAGDQINEEGCLSLPGITGQILRSDVLRLSARDVAGQPIEQEAEGYVARIWQHEIDHLNGTLILDRMDPVARMTHRRTLKELEAKYKEEHPKKDAVVGKSRRW